MEDRCAYSHPAQKKTATKSVPRHPGTCSLAKGWGQQWLAWLWLLLPSTHPHNREGEPISEQPACSSDRPLPLWQAKLPPPYPLQDWGLQCTRRQPILGWTAALMTTVVSEQSASSTAPLLQGCAHWLFNLTLAPPLEGVEHYGRLRDDQKLPSLQHITVYHTDVICGAKKNNPALQRSSL